MITELPSTDKDLLRQVELPGVDHAVYMTVELGIVTLQYSTGRYFSITGDSEMLLIALNLLNVTLITERTITKLERHTPVRITSPNTLDMPLFMLTTGNSTSIFTNKLVAIDELTGGDDAVVTQLRKLGYEYA